MKADLSILFGSYFVNHVFDQMVHDLNHFSKSKFGITIKFDVILKQQSEQEADDLEIVVIE